MPWHYFSRLLWLCRVWVKHDLDEVLFALPWLKPIRFILKLNPIKWFRKNNNPLEVRLRLALEELGPIYIKFGQMLSTRRDLLPANVAEELAKLQDKVVPFLGEDAKRIVESELEAPVEQVFAEFHTEPLASASVAQVHAATLHSGESVVVKVIRPKIHSTLKKDFALLSSLARMASKLKQCKRLKPTEVVAELKDNLENELDLLREASNASQLRRNCEGDERIYIPKVYWPYCRKRVMVMERVGGIPVSDLTRLKAAATEQELKMLAEYGVELFYKQVFQDSFFHADMHPGNLFVSLETPGKPKFIAIDFGIMGSLAKHDKNYLAANFLSFFKRDYQKVAELHIECGWVPPDTRVDQFESALRTVCEPIFEKPLREISCGQTLMRLFQIARRFHMEVMPQLLLLQKTLINIEGMGRSLYPDLDLWATARPYLENWMKQHVGLKGLWRRTKEQLPFISERLPELPKMVYQILEAQSKNALFASQQPSAEKKGGGKLACILFIIGWIVVLYGAWQSSAPVLHLGVVHAMTWHHLLIWPTGLLCLLVGWRLKRR